MFVQEDHSSVKFQRDKEDSDGTRVTARSMFGNPNSPLTDVHLWIGVRYISCAHAALSVLLVGESEHDVDGTNRPKTKEYAYGKFLYCLCGVLNFLIIVVF